VSETQGEPESVHALTSAIASGDTEGFARFYRAWFDFTLNEARRLTGRDEQFCLDAVQETMLRVIRRMKPLPHEAALSAWLRAAVRSASIDLLRRDLRRRRRETSNARPASAEASCGDDQRERRLARERIDWLRAQLAAMPPEQARLLDLRFRLGWTLSRIAGALSLKTGAVDGRINRALEQLRSSAPEDFHE
jgi:RNA polymerase sigma factor (sigma-70 family)